jgi:hypothetical protein
MVSSTNGKKSNRRVKTWLGERIPFSDDPQQQRSLYELSDHDLRTHGLILGATGSGKTVAIHHLIAQEVLHGRSFVVLDMRGDLVDATLAICEGRVHPSRIKLLDLREKKFPMGFNPLVGRGESYYHALNVLKVIAAESESWGVQLEETLRCALIALAEARSSITELERFLTAPDFRSSLLKSVESENIKRFWERYSSLSQDRQRSLSAPVLNKVSALLATKNLRAILGSENPIDLGKHLDTAGSVLLVCLAADQLHASGMMMGSLMLGSISREIFARVSEPEAKRNPVRLFVDEFEHFGTEEFGSLLVESRRMKLSLVLAHQTLAQLPPSLRANILANVGVKTLFRLGRDDSNTLSSDIAVRKNAIDFTTLAIGHALIWNKRRGLAMVAVNAPLFKGSSWHGPEIRRYRLGVYLAHHLNQIEKIQWQPPQDVIDATCQSKLNQEESSKCKMRLEDWL